MDNVVGFPAKKEGIWYCHCGCSTHLIRTDGEIECVSCGAFASGLVGEYLKPPVMAVPEIKDGRVTRKVVEMNDAPLSVKRVLDSVNVETVAGIVVLDEGGIVRTWGRRAETQERRDWFKSQLECALEELSR